MGSDGRRRHLQQTLLHLVGIAYNAADEVVRAAGEGCEPGAEQTSGARFGCSDGRIQGPQPVGNELIDGAAVGREHR